MPSIWPCWRSYSAPSGAPRVSRRSRRSAGYAGTLRVPSIEDGDRVDFDQEVGFGEARHANQHIGRPVPAEHGEPRSRDLVQVALSAPDDVNRDPRDLIATGADGIQGPADVRERQPSL